MVQKPEQLSAFLEEISGSIVYKPQYDALKTSMDEIENEIAKHTKKLSSLRSEKRRLRSQKSNSEIY